MTKIHWFQCLEWDVLLLFSGLDHLKLIRSDKTRHLMPSSLGNCVWFYWWKTVNCLINKILIRSISNENICLSQPWLVLSCVVGLTVVDFTAPVLVLSHHFHCSFYVETLSKPWFHEPSLRKSFHNIMGQFKNAVKLKAFSLFKKNSQKVCWYPICNKNLLLWQKHLNINIILNFTNCVWIHCL